MNHSRLAEQLWSRLWEEYRSRVAYARTYESMIQSAGGVVANDHIAFRSLKMSVDRQGNRIDLGVSYLAEIFQLLGYQVTEEYQFPERHLSAYCYRHPDQQELALPKLFVSELRVEELPDEIAKAIQAAVQSGQFFSLKSFQKNQIKNVGLSLEEDSKDGPEIMAMAYALANVFVRPWNPPRRKIVEAVNQVSQYGAWVLLHGYSVNHFTGYINRQQTLCYPNLEATSKALAAQGVPMKSRIEGSKDSGLKQTATQSVIENVTVENQEGDLEQISWNYAYYELAERFYIEDANKRKSLFQGFISPQAKHLFEMTRMR